jgi:hypothetical protein
MSRLPTYPVAPVTKMHRGFISIATYKDPARKDGITIGQPALRHHSLFLARALSSTSDARSLTVLGCPVHRLLGMTRGESLTGLERHRRRSRSRRVPLKRYRIKEEDLLRESHTAAEPRHTLPQLQFPTTDPVRAVGFLAKALSSFKIRVAGNTGIMLRVTSLHCFHSCLYFTIPIQKVDRYHWLMTCDSLSTHS